MHAAVKPIMDATNMLANTVDLANQARALGVHILLFSRPMADQAVISGLRGDHLSRARTRGYEAA